MTFAYAVIQNEYLRNELHKLRNTAAGKQDNDGNQVNITLSLYHHQQHVCLGKQNVLILNL